MPRDKVAKAAYDKKRRAGKSESIRAYDNERNAIRRTDPAYAEAQVKRKRKWREANKERHLLVSRAYDKNTLATNPQRRIAKNLRHRISKAMKGQTRGFSAITDLGCSVDDFRAYIASKFQEGMCWENYGEWHLDHIRPLASFDLTDDSKARAAVHFTNYQPLWAIENQRKHAKEFWPANHASAVQAVIGAKD